MLVHFLNFQEKKPQNTVSAEFICHDHLGARLSKAPDIFRALKAIAISKNLKTLRLQRCLHKVLYSQTFSPCVINLSHNKNIFCGLKKVVARSRTRVYFEQQILVLLLVFHQTHNLSQLAAQQICSCPCKSANHRAAFLQPALTNLFVAGQIDRTR